jgi:uncharacterized protein DUF3303
MLFMVIERFRPGKVEAIGERFRRDGRMLPEGVVYHSSWVDAASSRCYQIMEAPSAKLLDEWTSRWADLVDFEVIPVVTSAQFWEHTRRDQP